MWPAAVRWSVMAWPKVLGPAGPVKGYRGPMKKPPGWVPGGCETGSVEPG